MTRTRIIPIRFIAPIALITVPLTAGGAAAQVGGLIKNKINQVSAAAQQIKFDNVILEITPDRINKLLAAKQASKPVIDGPNGPSAINTTIIQVEARQTAIAEKEVDAIQTWEQKLRDHRNCLDSALIAIADRARDQLMARAMSDPRFMQLTQALLVAQQKGDTAAVRKLAGQLERLKAPTSADTAAAAKQCGASPAALGPVKQWADLRDQVDTLRAQLTASEDAIRAMEARLSGMETRQIAMMCERIRMYAEQLRNKSKVAGFSASEQQTLTNLSQAVKDLEALCP